MARLDRRAKALNDLRLDALHYRGPGTDLEVGLLERTRFWLRALPYRCRPAVHRQPAD